MTWCDVGVPLANKRQVFPLAGGHLPRYFRLILHSHWVALTILQTRAGLFSVLQALRYRFWDNFCPTTQICRSFR